MDKQLMDLEAFNTQIMRILPTSIKRLLMESFKGISGSPDPEKLQEMRFRIGKPFIMLYDNKELYYSHIVKKEEIKEMLDLICEYSAYAYEEEMRQGFITIPGGHRAGISGKVIAEDGKVKNIKHVSSINLRIAHEIKGCADSIINYLFTKETLLHTLIISVPGGGKTTLLRDIIRQLSNGTGTVPGMNVAVVDERSEICACYRGIPQNDVGIRTDVLDGCPKAEGMMRLIRSMSPQVIAVDEIGTTYDLEAIRYVLTCGCAIIATHHGSAIPENILGEKLFSRYIILDAKKHGRISGVYDSAGRML